jgi:hypothetical protein
LENAQQAIPRADSSTVQMFLGFARPGAQEFPRDGNRNFIRADFSLFHHRPAESALSSP